MEVGGEREMKERVWGPGGGGGGRENGLKCPHYSIDCEGWGWTLLPLGRFAHSQFSSHSEAFGDMELIFSPICPKLP